MDESRMNALSAGPVPLPGVSLETWMIRFDKHGANESPQATQALLGRLAEAPQSPVIVFSHGWNNNDVSASERYATFLQRLEAHFSAFGGPAAPPIFIGLRWPSMWFPFDKAPAAFVDAAVADAEVESELTQLAAVLTDELPANQRADFQTLLARPRLSDGESEELVDLLAPLMQAAEAGIAEGVEASGINRQELLTCLRTIQPEQSAFTDAQEMQMLNWKKAVSWKLWLLRLASVWTMKARAGTVGRNGVSQLVRSILERSPAPLHLVGHSYGAKVVLSAVCAQPLPRQVGSLLLLQAAISYLCFAENIPEKELPGGYRAALARTAGSVAASFSRWDSSLHSLYHHIMRVTGDFGELEALDDAFFLAAESAGEPPNNYAALGGYGPREAGEILLPELPAPGVDVAALRTRGLIAFDGSKGKRIPGHGKVSNEYTAWLLYQQMKNQ